MYLNIKRSVLVCQDHTARSLSVLSINHISNKPGTGAQSRTRPMGTFPHN